MQQLLVVYVCSLNVWSPAYGWYSSDEKWAVLSRNFAPSGSVVLIPSSPSRGNASCPSGFKLTSEQWAFSALWALLRADILQEHVYVTAIRLQKQSFWHFCFYAHRIDLAVAWGAQVLFDTFIFLLTLMRSLRIWQERSRSIIEILLRDGVSFELAPPALKLTLIDY